jgi:hypothetical protein
VKFFRRITSLLALGLAIGWVTGCAKATAPTPPPPPLDGAANQFDSDSYKTLVAVQATLNSLNTSYKANPTGLASLKPTLDQAASDYNIAEALWQAYHSAALSGMASTTQQTALSTSLTKVQNDLASVPK